MKNKKADNIHSQAEISNCTFVKTALMLMVVIYHCIVFWTGNWFTKNPVYESNLLYILAKWMNSFHVFAFALVSGYIFAFQIMRGGYSKYIPFLRNKAKRLLIPCVFVALIWVAPIESYFFDCDFGYLAKKYLLAINPSQLWFLWMLFGVFTIAWPLRNVMLKKPIWGYVIAFVFYGVSIIGNKLLPNVFCVWTACQYVIFFFIGMRIRVKEASETKKITELIPCYLWVAADCLLFIGSMLIDPMDGMLWRIISFALNFLLHIVGSIMAWTSLQILAAFINWNNNKWFAAFSSYSMPIYLLHQQIIYFTITWLNGKVNPYAHAGINFMAALAGSFIISSLLMKWKVTRFLIGEK